MILSTTSNFIHDKIASSYGFNINRSTIEHLKYTLVEKYTTKDSNVLDIGCANGIYSLPLSSFVKTITAIDINDKLLKIFQKKIQEKNIHNINIKNHDVRCIKDLNGKYDIVFSFSTLLLVPEIESVFQQLPQITFLNGKLILDITGRYNLSQVFWKNWYSSQGHHTLNSFSWNEIKIKLQEIGFRIVESHSLGFCDQWKYFPLVNRVANRLSFIDKIFHHKVGGDIDYKVSQMWPFCRFANRWLIVAERVK